MRWLHRLLTRPDEALSSVMDEELAAAALLYEVARADGQFRAEETRVLLQRLARRWNLPGEQARELLERAEGTAESIVDLHPLVHSLRQHWGQPQRISLVHDMWEVAHADGHVDPYEEHLIRRVADLLHVPHHEFIRGKLKPE